MENAVKKLKRSSFTLKNVRSKVPPLQGHFLAIFERVFTRAKIEIQTFWTPQMKNF